MVVFETNFPGLKLVHRGKVRDLYEIDDYLLLVATDRISAYDVVMPTPIPDKGKVLTQMSLFWFDYLKDIVPNHLVTADVNAYPASCLPYREELSRRSMLVVKADPLPVECIVRGYLSGSAWASYKREGEVCGLKLPPGLRESDRLPEPIFTPSTKAAQGEHDENITFSQMAEIIGQDMANKVRDISLAIYLKASTYAEERGIIIADTKFEFGLKDGELILIDEVLTPDSSRFWPREEYEPGRPQKSFDKQFLRDWLVSIGWNKRPPAPELPEDIVKKTRNRYIEALRRLTGEDFGDNAL
ncbi:phosphoribosylaminoimidazolesuccinocarboxamide synthase [Thermosulfuriphilus ammonigenes]|uniref:Phosphoribosylaminoimidazole-succinocarboxamide synthase n=1 Tax=Thermosulfuriphilus ammonigenes TaxID=1936021 RepID=A0A6G7PXT8_9BACT|nr:phosphoribosylaminoimidazolesuccinocarboxamide synthase [Thermosulfuriphilus ammonigenes]MBA2849401.1 phosphoribosylaminoimidazole-succinocarboxamide synthase [Thermosulfuriphilus ammonigenes]QIJ72472.1 phosphoribosylaminoimidazolesuccinocarboxamide synthase [Thermosulfuriphilus ammonigenes]